jgi:hypothetical protein
MGLGKAGKGFASFEYSVFPIVRVTGLIPLTMVGQKPILVKQLLGLGPRKAKLICKDKWVRIPNINY